MTQHLASEAEVLRRADEERRMMMRLIAHELAGPLTPLRMLPESLGAGGVMNVACRAMMERSLARLERLVRDVGELAAADWEGMKVVLGLHDVVPVLRGSVADLAGKARAAGVTLGAMRLQDASLFVDSVRISQVLHNLIENALKLTPQGGRVTVESMWEGHWYRIDVSDTGPGLSLEQAQRLFVPFSRVHHHAEGSGLGLHISKQIVKAHRGSIEATSPGPGHGSTFTVRLPASGLRPR